MEIKTPLIVNAFWDNEASVWVATSDDVPGLATEAEAMNALVEKLKIMIPELLDANDCPGENEIAFQVNMQLTAIAHRKAA